MKRKTLNLLIILSLITVVFLGGAVYILNFLDKRATEQAFNRELRLFDSSIGTESRELLNRSVRSLFQAAKTSDQWLRLIKRSYAFGTVYNDYSLYLETAQQGVIKYAKHPSILKFYFDALVKNGKIENVPRAIKTYGIPPGNGLIATLAFIKADERTRDSFTGEIPFRSVLTELDETSLLNAYDATEDVRFLCDVSVNRAVRGAIVDAAIGIPYEVIRQFPEVYSVLAYDRGDYDNAISLFSVLETKFQIMPEYLRHLSFDALYLSNREKSVDKAYAGYERLSRKSDDWRPALNVLLRFGADAYPDLLQKAEIEYGQVPEVCRYLGDYWYLQGNNQKSSVYYRRLLEKRPDNIAARLRLAETERGYITQGMLKEILWDIYYDEAATTDPQIRETATLYLLWYAIGSQDSGVVGFFRGQLTRDDTGNLMIALWDLLHENAENCLSLLEGYSGNFVWYSLYLKGTACLVMGRYQTAMEHFENALKHSDADTWAVGLKIAECLYYSGDPGKSYKELKNLQDKYPLKKGTEILEKKIMEKL